MAEPGFVADGRTVSKLAERERKRQELADAHPRQ